MYDLQRKVAEKQIEMQRFRERRCEGEKKRNSRFHYLIAKR